MDFARALRKAYDANAAFWRSARTDIRELRQLVLHTSSSHEHESIANRGTYQPPELPGEVSWTIPEPLVLKARPADGLDLDSFFESLGINDGLPDKAGSA